MIKHTTSQNYHYLIQNHRQTARELSKTYESHLIFNITPNKKHQWSSRISSDRIKGFSLEYVNESHISFLSFTSFKNQLHYVWSHGLPKKTELDRVRIYPFRILSGATINLKNLNIQNFKINCIFSKKGVYTWCKKTSFFKTANKTT